jgi:hypothetical protein
MKPMPEMAVINSENADKAPVIACQHGAVEDTVRLRQRIAT